jgi:excisionase family DNA binding protein
MAKKTTPKTEDLITQAEAARLRGVSLASINELVQRGRLRVVELFGRKLLYRAEVESFRKLKTGPKARRPPTRKRAARKKSTNAKK